MNALEMFKHPPPGPGQEHSQTPTANWPTNATWASHQACCCPTTTCARETNPTSQSSAHSTPDALTVPLPTGLARGRGQIWYLFLNTPTPLEYGLVKPTLTPLYMLCKQGAEPHAAAEPPRRTRVSRGPGEVGWAPTRPSSGKGRQHGTAHFSSLSGKGK